MPLICCLLATLFSEHSATVTMTLRLGDRFRFPSGVRIEITPQQCTYIGLICGNEHNNNNTLTSKAPFHSLCESYDSHNLHYFV